MQKDFKAAVAMTIHRYQLLNEGEEVLAAVSGGADSVSLLLILRELGYRVSAFHVEHGIRSGESLADCEYVEQLCRSEGIPFGAAHIDVPALAAKSGRSLEEEARLRRYELLEDAAAGRKIAVAHNRNDQAETVLWNLVRGCGLRGLTGIRPARSSGGGQGSVIIRPLIDVSRSDIEAYLGEKGVPFCTDRTNFDREITRNRMRLSVLPELERLNTQTILHIAQTAEDLAGVETFLERETQASFQKLYHSHALDLEGLEALDEVIRKRVFRLAVEREIRDRSLKDISRKNLADLMELAQKDCGRSVSLPRGLTAVRENGVIRFTETCSPIRAKMPAGTDSGTLAGGGMPSLPGAFSGMPDIRIDACRDGTYKAAGITFHCSFSIWKGGPVPEKRYTKWLRYDTISPNLCIRTRRKGDYLTVTKNGGRKKLKDYLIDQKIPRDMRDQLLLVAEGSRILWVVGYRISEDAKVGGGDPCMRVECETL